VPGEAKLSRARTAEQEARAAGAADLFLFRRVEQRSFAHIGGFGRGASWAGIVEIGLADEPTFAAAVDSGLIGRHYRPLSWHVFGPYYGQAVAIVPVSDDVVAVFGSAQARLLELDDAEFHALALRLSESISGVTAAKYLADELEVVNTIRDVLRLPASTLDETLQGVIDLARQALSCELGVLYTRLPRRVAVSDPGCTLTLETRALCMVMETIGDRGDFPICVQDVRAGDLPAPFSHADGVIAYYLLELPAPVSGVMLLLHTKAAPRGFTLLCQSLGLRLVDAAGALFETALARDNLRAELARSSREARRDALTGVGNRLSWDEAIASFGSAGKPVSIILLDCRGLKRANDTLGHDVGDRLLRRVAEIVAACVREGDLVARIGGDEFAVLLTDADETVTAVITERIRAAVDAEPPIESVAAAVAIGAATTRDGDLKTAQRSADARMRDAKRRSPLR